MSLVTVVVVPLYILYRAKLVSKLKRIGLTVDPEKLITASSAAANVIKREKLNPLLLIAPETAEEFEPHYSKSNQIIKSKNYSAFDSVIIGLSKPDFVYERLNIAFHVLHYQKDSKLYAINRARYLNENNGNGVTVKSIDGNEEQKMEEVPGNINNLATGAFVAGLEYSTGKESVVIGKPSPHFFAAGLERIGTTVEDTVMIGDDYKDDVGGSMQFGMRGILVKTGKYRKNDEEKLDSPPSATVASIDKAVEWILSCNKQSSL